MLYMQNCAIIQPILYFKFIAVWIQCPYKPLSQSSTFPFKISFCIVMFIYYCQSDELYNEHAILSNCVMYFKICFWAWLLEHNYDLS